MSNFTQFDLGLMNQPDALLMCLRQITAKKTSIPFENLIAYISCNDPKNDNT